MELGWWGYSAISVICIGGSAEWGYNPIYRGAAFQFKIAFSRRSAIDSDEDPYEVSSDGETSESIFRAMTGQ